MSERLVSGDEPSIMDGVADVTGAKWLRFGTSARSVWLSLVEISILSSATIASLHAVGFTLVANTSKEKFKREAEAFSAYRIVPLISRPGWTEGAYTHADGTTRSLAQQHNERLVVLTRDPRFAASGSLAEWQDAFGPLVRGQPLPLVILGFAFVGPLLRFMPPDVQNPIIELVGEPERGKSSLAHAASAVWGGDPANRMGIARSWNFSPERIDEMRAEFSDCLLVLDEANHAGRNEKERATTIDATIFRLESTASRERYGQLALAPVRQAILSTSNEAMHELVRSRPGARAAVISRVLTLKADRAQGIFDTLPDGLTGRDAVEALTAASVRFSGTAGHAFTERLAQRTAKAISRAVGRGMNRATTHFALRGLTPRHAKILAAVWVGGRIAQQLGVIPRDWGSMTAACRALLPSPSAQRTSAVTSIRDYMKRHERQIVCLERRSSRRLTAEEFDVTPGFVRQDGSLIIIPTAAAKRWLTANELVMRQLQAEDRLDHDKGFRSKKAPRWLTPSRRAYFVKLD